MHESPDWNLIRSLLAIIDYGTLHAAAAALGTSQPTLSRQVAKLESQLGCILFERTGRTLTPTPTAVRLVELARPMEQAANQLTLRARGSGHESGGTIRVSASQPVACHLLPPLLARLRLLEPAIQIELIVSNSMSDLLRRQADIALRMVDPVEPDLIARRIGEVRIGACAAPEYLRRKGIPRKLADLVQHDLVGPATSDELIDGLGRAGITIRREDLALRTDDLIAASAAVRAGMGIGFLANYLTRGEPGLVPVLPDLATPTLPMWIVVHRELRSSTLLRRVFDFLATEVPLAL